MNISPALSSFLDLSRWVSAFIVVISHLRNLLFIDYEFVRNKNILIQGFYFITGFGHSAVIIFFVLSGFLVGGSVLRRFKLKKFSLTKYSIDRFSRIYIVFPLTLLTGFGLDWLGYSYFNSTGIYSNHFHFATAGFDIYERLNLGIFVSNLCMLQTIVTPTFGSNGPLWSLANEWWYYFYFPLIILSFTHKVLIKRIICLLASLCLSIMMYNSNEHGNMLFLFSIWLVGTLFWLKPLRISVNFWFSSLLMILYASFIRISEINSLSVFRELILAVLFCLMISSVNESCKFFVKMAKINSLMASFSYSLYLVHLPLAIFVVAVLSRLQIMAVQMQPVPITFVMFFLILIVIYIYSFCFATFTENHTPRLKKALYNHLT